MSPALLEACAVCAQSLPSRLAVLMPVMLGFPYLVALVVIALVRRLDPKELP